MPDQAVTEGKAARTRRALQRATLDVVAETGEFTGEAVAERCGVSTPTFYAQFATKDHAIAAALELCFEDFARRIAAVESIERLLDDGLEETIRQIVATTVEVKGDYRSLLRLARSRVQASPLLRERSREAEASAYAATLRFVELAQAARLVRDGDPVALTATVRAVLDGLDSWIIRTHPGVADEEIPRLICRYLLPERS
jgi:AcrR family transcriptional regulator